MTGQNPNNLDVIDTDLKVDILFVAQQLPHFFPVTVKTGLNKRRLKQDQAHTNTKFVSIGARNGGRGRGNP